MITSEKQRKTTTVKTETYDLVNGVFSPEDGHEVVIDLLSKKISFHVRKNFSHLIRSGSEDEKSLKRIHELTDAEEKVKALFQQAASSGKSVRVHSTITLEII